MTTIDAMLTPIPYIHLGRAKEAIQSSYSNAGGVDDNILLDIIRACSAFTDRYTNRPYSGFLQQSYDELYHGTGDYIMFLRNVPVVSIQRIAGSPQPACWVHNTDSDMGARATVAVTSTGVTLTYVKNAVTTTQTFAFTTYPTISQLSAAIGAAGNNWTSGIMGGYGGWSSSDLRYTQGAYGARLTNTYLWIHWFDLPAWRVDEENGKIYSQYGFDRGNFNWRVNYTAGYAADAYGIPQIPADLQQAIAELVALTYNARSVNGNVQQENLGPMSYTQSPEKSFDNLSLLAKKTFGYYKRRIVPKFSTW